MMASITGRMSDGVVRGLIALGVRIQFVRFDPRTGLPVHQLSTTGGTDADVAQQDCRAAEDYRALGVGRCSSSGRGSADVGADRQDVDRGRLDGDHVRQMTGVATAGQGSSDISQ